MGNGCCCANVRSEDMAMMNNGMAPLSRERTSVSDKKFMHELFEKYELVSSCLSAHVGQSESFIYKLKEKYMTIAHTDGTADEMDIDPKLLIVHSIIASNLTGFGPTAILEYLDKIKPMRDPRPLERDVFVRPSGQYYLTANYIDQSTNDLFALCMARGAFKENEIG